MLYEDFFRLGVQKDRAVPLQTERADQSRNLYRPRFVYGSADATIDPIPSLVYDSQGQYIAESFLPHSAAEKDTLDHDDVLVG